MGAGGGAPRERTGGRKMFTLADDRKHTKSALHFRDVLSKDV